MLLSEHVIAGNPNFDVFFSGMRSHIFLVRHLLCSQQIFWTVGTISYNLFCYLEQVKMFHSRLSSSDFSAIHVGDDFETLLTTSDSNFMSLRTLRADSWTICLVFLSGVPRRHHGNTGRYHSKPCKSAVYGISFSSLPNLFSLTSFLFFRSSGYSIMKVF